MAWIFGSVFLVSKNDQYDQHWYSGLVCSAQHKFTKTYIKLYIFTYKNLYITKSLYYEPVCIVHLQYNVS